MKTAAAKSHNNHHSNPAKLVFQGDREGAFFSQVETGIEETGPVARRKAAFESDDEVSHEPSLRRKPAFDSERESADGVDVIQQTPLSSGLADTLQPRLDPAGIRSSQSTDSPDASPVAGARPSGFLQASRRPFFTPTAPHPRPRLKVGRPDDRFEREAESMADRVVSRPEKSRAAPPPIERQEDQDGAALHVQRQVDGDVNVSSDVESHLARTKGKGRELDSDTRTGMETAFGTDFSGVRIHTGSEAAQLSSELGAEAFTHGGDVYFNEGKYRPDTSAGKHLLAHELTHTVQQGASVRRRSLSRTGGPRIQRLSLSSLANRVLRNVPGWTLMTVIIGRNPVTGDTVPRTATNILDGLLGLLPGGAILADKLRKTGALAEAGNWLSSEVDKLGITYDYIKSLFSRAWEEFSIWKGISGNLAVAKRIFGEPYRRIKAFVGRIATKIKEFIFRGALKLVGAPVDTIMGILNKGADVISRIISDPIGFFRNLGSAVAGGVKKFVGNIRQHLITGLIDWLTGAMSGLPITLPAHFDLKGIISLVLQILGLTWDRIREKLVKRVGEKVVSAVETGVDIVQRIRQEGPMALWDMIKEKAAEIKQQVMEGIRNWVITQVVKQAVIKVLSFINPAGALVQAAIGLYNLVMFLYENMSRIIEFVRSVFNSIGEIARGNIGKAVEFIHQTLARTVPIMLNFLARLIGLGSVGKAVTKIIKKIRKPIDKMVDKVIDKIAKLGKKLFKKGKAAARGIKEKFVKWWTTRVGFKGKDGKAHNLLLEKKGVKAVMYMASTKTLVEKALEARPSDDQNAKTALSYYRNTVQKKEDELEQADQTYRGIPTSKKKEKRAARYQVQKMTNDLRGLMKTFSDMLAKIQFDGAPAGTVRTEIDKRPDKGRAGFVEAKPLTHLPGKFTGSSPQEDPPGWEFARDAGWKRGHLLSEHLHGPGLAWNLTPVSTSTNSQMESVESEVRPLIRKQENILYYRVDVTYDDSKKEPYKNYPTAIDMEWGYLKKPEGTSGKYSEQKEGGKPLRNLGDPDPQGVPNVNEAGRPTLINKGISRQLAQDIPKLRTEYLPANKFDDLDDLIDSLQEYYENKYTHLQTGERTNFTSDKMKNFKSKGRAELVRIIEVEQKLKIE